MSEPANHVDLTNCDREPIHILGAIQSFGCLVAVSSDWLISRLSANIGQHLAGAMPEQLLGQPLVNVFTAEAIHTIRNRMLYLTGSDTVERVFNLELFQHNPARFDLAVHRSNGQIVVEAEAAQADAISAAGTIRSMMARLDQADSLEGFFREAARQLRGLTGFDRVMVYRFDEQEAGEVVAESARSGIGSFLGLHYPASDIPVQARALYVRSLFRIIADVHAPPIPIVPQRDENGAPLDLSIALTRAVSPIHIEYLINMGVAASLSISIVIDGKLWGLFVCHHYTARLPSLERRSLAELFGQMFAMKLDARERQRISDNLAKARSVADSLLGALAGNAQLLEDPDWLGDTLNRAIDSDGMGISINGRVALAGLTPSATEFTLILRALNATASSRVFSTDRICDLLPQAAGWTTPAVGMLSMPISRSPRDYIVLFRQERVRTVRWAGDPSKPVQHGPSGARLTPRKSFDSWAEQVSGRSRPFDTTETRVAEMLRTTLIEVVLRLSEDAHAERQLATDRQELLIAELNHRVRNILSLIGGLVRRSRSGTRSIDDYVKQIDSRISALARAHNQITQHRWGAASLRSLIETETEAYLVTGKSNRVVLEGNDVLLVPAAFSTLALVFHELITNCAKYGGLSDSGSVTIGWKRDDSGDLLLQWCEQGGPAVQAPTHQGFGSTIIRRSVPYDLGGTADIKFNLAGLEAYFRIPARHIAISDVAAPAASVSTAAGDHSVLRRPQVLKGATVLLVEDSLIIAIDTEDNLMQLGASRVLSVATVEQALDEILREQPTVALLDVNLGEQTSVPIALELLSLGVPFVFATGYGDRISLPNALSRVPVLQKPYTIDDIAGVMGELTGTVSIIK